MAFPLLGVLAPKLLYGLVVTAIVVGLGGWVYNKGVTHGKNEVISTQVAELTAELRQRDVALTIAKSNIESLERARQSAVVAAGRIRNEINQLPDDKPAFSDDRLQLLRDYSTALPGH